MIHTVWISYNDLLSRWFIALSWMSGIRCQYNWSTLKSKVTRQRFLVLSFCDGALFDGFNSIPYSITMLLTTAMNFESFFQESLYDPTIYERIMNLLAGLEPIDIYHVTWFMLKNNFKFIWRDASQHNLSTKKSSKKAEK